MRAAVERGETSDILGPEFLENPYPTYRRLRDQSPIIWSDEFFGGAWVVSRHADVELVLRDKRFSAQRTGGWVNKAQHARGDLTAFQQLFARAMLFRDPPDHQRLRRILNVAFRPSDMQALHPRIEDLTDRLLDEMDMKSDNDFMEAFASQLPARVIATLLGIDSSDHSVFVKWSADLADFIGATRPSTVQAHRAQASLMEMAKFFEPLLELRRKTPCDDILGRLAAAESTGEVTDTAELLAQCAMLLFAGHETTRNLLGNGLYTLLSDHSHWERLVNKPELTAAAAKELARYESPVQYTGRRVATDLVLKGARLRRGDLVVALIGAANRDPGRYPDPDALDLDREQGMPLSFGTGIHVCIGAHLSLLETSVALKALIRRWPNLELGTTKPQWNGNAVYRGLKHLHVRSAHRA